MFNIDPIDVFQSVTSKNPCPVCGCHEWYMYVENYVGPLTNEDIEILSAGFHITSKKEKFKLIYIKPFQDIDCIVDVPINSNSGLLGTYYDVCANCETVIW